MCLCVTAISAEAKTKKTTVKDGKYITWNYDKDTKTLTFSGKGPISEFEMDGHGSEPEWYVWNEQTEHIGSDPCPSISKSEMGPFPENVSVFVSLA